MNDEECIDDIHSSIFIRALLIRQYEKLFNQLPYFQQYKRIKKWNYKL